MVRRITLAIALCFACAGDAKRRADDSTQPRRDVGPVAAQAIAGASRPGAPLGEVEARMLLAERFRRAGLRVLYDIAIDHADSQLTLDGYDPDRRIGFEYIAADERGADLVDRERAQLSGAALDPNAPSILIVDAAPAHEVGELADAFLAKFSGLEAQ
jgi:hypothetical protein